jgi:hypothetical protein
MAAKTHSKLGQGAMSFCDTGRKYRFTDYVPDTDV